MQTRFSTQQLEDPDLRAADAILRRCVHCGFCNAACPTFALQGDELEGPRGRIWLIRDMLESNTAGSAEAVRHIDSCLSCLSCMSACPSGIDYMHLVDIGRAHVEARHRRPPRERLLRAALAAVLPRPRLARFVFNLGRALRFLQDWLPASLRPAVALLRETRASAPIEGHYPAQGSRRGRVALLAGCVQEALAPDINAAAVRVLTRAGFDVDVISDCCGAMEQHLGYARRARHRVQGNVQRWHARFADADAILTTASGCGTVLKDYGFLLREHLQNREAQAIAARVQDISEFLVKQDGAAGGSGQGQRVAVPVPCSLRHGQRQAQAPGQLLAKAGFEVVEPAEDHLCCGSAGTYNLQHPETAAELGRRKAAHIEATGAEIVAGANLGCMLQLRGYLGRPVLHVVQLLDEAQSRGQ